jgi:hypothetical protein
LKVPQFLRGLQAGVCFLDRVLFLFRQRDSERNKLDGKALDDFFGVFWSKLGL